LSTVLRVELLAKTYKAGDGDFFAVKDVDLEVSQGEFVAIMGPSGSGKSTLLHLISGLELPSRGTISLCDINLTDCSDDERTRVRSEKIGFVFQFFNLIPVLSALENVVLPLLMAGHKESAIHNRAISLLTDMGLGNHLQKRPKELSGGQQQRVAIARAMLANPPILMADEPTGNLDTKTGFDVLRLLQSACRAPQRQALILVTHDPRVAALADRVLFMRDSEIVGETHNPDLATNPENAAQFLYTIQQKWEVLMS